MLQKPNDSDLNWGHSDLRHFPLKSMHLSVHWCVLVAFIKPIGSNCTKISFGSISLCSHKSRSPWPLTSDLCAKVQFYMYSNGDWFWWYFSGTIGMDHSVYDKWSPLTRPFVTYQPFDLDLIFKVTVVTYIISQSNFQGGTFCMHER